MDKILILLFVPPLSTYYEVFVPSTLTIGNAMRLIVDGVIELSDNQYFSSGEEMLCLNRAGVLSQLNKSFHEYGIKNGDEITLI